LLHCNILATVDPSDRAAAGAGATQEDVAMSFKDDFPHYAAIHSQVHQAGAERAVYVGEAVADGIVIAWRWVASITSGLGDIATRSAHRKRAARPLIQTP
jgi:hypothetical protein